MFCESGTISFIVKPLRKAALHSGWGRKAAEKIKRWLLALFHENLKHIICLKIVITASGYVDSLPQTRENDIRLHTLW